MFFTVGKTEIDRSLPFTVCGISKQSRAHACTVQSAWRQTSNEKTCGDLIALESIYGCFHLQKHNNKDINFFKSLVRLMQEKFSEQF